MVINDQNWQCHSGRSEESARGRREILSAAKNDSQEGFIKRVPTLPAVILSLELAVQEDTP